MLKWHINPKTPKPQEYEIEIGYFLRNAFVASHVLVKVEFRLNKMCQTFMFVINLSIVHHFMNMKGGFQNTEAT